MDERSGLGTERFGGVHVSSFSVLMDRNPFALELSHFVYLSVRQSSRVSVSGRDPRFPGCRPRCPRSRSEAFRGRTVNWIEHKSHRQPEPTRTEPRGGRI